MKIIDFEKLGNVVRFFLGKSDLKDWYGDDWDDYPYEHNAGTVYERFTSGYFDVAWNADWFVMEPCDGEYNSEYCKDDMRRGLACIVAALPRDDSDGWYGKSYSRFVARKDAEKVYFGDEVSKYLKAGDVFHGGVVMKYVECEPKDD